MIMYGCLCIGSGCSCFAFQDVLSMAHFGGWRGPDEWKGRGGGWDGRGAWRGHGGGCDGRGVWRGPAGRMEGRGAWRGSAGRMDGHGAWRGRGVGGLVGPRATFHQDRGVQEWQGPGQTERPAVQSRPRDFNGGKGEKSIKEESASQLEGTGFVKPDERQGEELTEESASQLEGPGSVKPDERQGEELTQEKNVSQDEESRQDEKSDGGSVKPDDRQKEKSNSRKVQGEEPREEKYASQDEEPRAAESEKSVIHASSVSQGEDVENKEQQHALAPNEGDSKPSESGVSKEKPSTDDDKEEEEIDWTYCCVCDIKFVSESVSCLALLYSITQ